MYTVGQDVDTLVSRDRVIYLTDFALQNQVKDEFVFDSIALYAGKLICLGPLGSQINPKGTILNTIRSAGNLLYSTGGPKVPKLNDHLGPHRIPKNDDFCYYLAGLIEGAGYFGINLEIVQHEKDRPLASFLRSRIGYGQIYEVKDKRAIKFVISKKAGIDHVIELCDGKWVGPFKYKQQSKLGYINQKPPLNTLIISSSWLAGFLDADGSLGIFISKSKTHRLGCCVRQEIKLCQKKELQMLLIKDKLGGNLDLDKKGMHRLTFTGSKNIITMMNILDIYQLQSKKYLQYFILRRTFRLMQRKEHQTLIGLNKVKTYKQRISLIYKGDPQRPDGDPSARPIRAQRVKKEST